MPTKRLSVSLDAGDYAELVKLAKKRERSRAWLVRTAIKQMLRQDQSSSRDQGSPTKNDSSLNE